MVTSFEESGYNWPGHPKEDSGGTTAISILTDFLKTRNKNPAAYDAS